MFKVDALERLAGSPRSWCRLVADLAASWTLILSVAALVAAMVPQATSALELTRTAVADGEVWRLLTGHLTHFGASHLIWDLAVFVALGVVCERRWPRRTRLTLATSALAISIAVLFFTPGIDSYRGLSGIDSALFGLLAISLLREGEAPRNPLFTAALGLLVTGFAAKIGYELLTGTTFFVDSTAAGFVPVPVAHAVGFVVGAGIAWAGAARPIGPARSVPYDGRSMSGSFGAAASCVPSKA